MKQILYIILVATTILSCKKTDTLKVDTSGSLDNTLPPKPALNMYINDTFWQGTDPYGGLLTSTTAGDTAYGIYASGANSSKIELAFSSLKKGRQKLITQTAYTGGFYVYPVDTGSITISSYNSLKSQVSGTFQLNTKGSNKKIVITKGFFSNVNIYK